MFILPALLSPIGIILFFPLIYSKYSLLPPFWSTVGALLFGWGFIVVLVSYSAMPWLIVIGKDKIVFHRLFRRKLVISFSSIKGAEVISKKLPVKDYRWGIGSISFKMKDGDEWLVSGIGHVIILEICRRLKEYEVNCFEANRKLTDDEKRNLQKRGF